jgi:hypothetical protein
VATVGAGVGEGDVFGAHAKDEAAGSRLLQFGHGHRGVAEADAGRPGGGMAVERQEVHRRATNEIGDEQRGGVVVDILRGAELFDDAVVHHDDLVAHLHRLQLVVGDVYGGRLHPVVKGAKLL